ncbi:LacI family DNA-binding transcriptional regulator [Aestuariimicrobium sp. T2.26MG-19.2B]|uniref:LacI family DNA-binding transcriptional regulator n=1 Tax=Aestuariimicrobium sp. T2.26MG-19.2B TaxID=3040679 RepID=UPI0024775EA0|nr:LacI family DNA-binding transcriptional regulator [Aestuariimicrobium sp. T2.26MG-19.2B]CAI9410797.1 Ribose operon repressor [Aestuariimicrobium sp. T2.26MG-19.2B]
MGTMQDVARHAGVSVMTVSNVINGHPHVRESTRQKVLAAIAELDYHVNTAARNLRQGRTGVICLAVPDIDRPYFGLLATLLIERASARGYELVVEQTSARRDRELDSITRSRLRSYDGVMLSSVQLHDDDATLLRGDFPLVVFGERPFSIPIDHVAMANERGTDLATQHLIDQGCTRIAIIGGQVGTGEIDVSTLRAQGYLTAMERAGLTVNPLWVHHADYSFEGSLESTSRLLDELGSEGGRPPVDGLVCATDLIAVSAIRVLRDRGFSVPEDVLVVGFDDVPLAQFLTPSLSAVRPDHEGMVDAALDMLIERIEGRRDPDDYRTFIGDVTLVQRESTRR